MLTEIYIEALLVDEELADQVWALWFNGSVTDAHAAMAWWLIVISNTFEPKPDVQQNQLKWPNAHVSR